MPCSAQRRPWLLTGQQTPRASLPQSLTDRAEARAGPEGTRSSLRVHSEWLACLKPSVLGPDPHVPSCEGQLSSYVGKKDSPKQNEQTNKQSKLLRSPPRTQTHVHAFRFWARARNIPQYHGQNSKRETVFDQMGISGPRVTMSHSMQIKLESTR